MPKLSPELPFIEKFDLSTASGDFPHGVIPGSLLRRACAYLSTFVTRQAERSAHEVGFGWVGRSDAPDTYQDLQAAVEASQVSGSPLPVSDAHCDRVLFTSAAANLACRFWHDVSHVQRGRDFSTIQEIDLALWHLGRLEDEGIKPASLVWRLLHADMVGQTFCSAVLGDFPADQLTFDIDCVQFGVDDALVLEDERQQVARQQMSLRG